MFCDCLHYDTARASAMNQPCTGCDAPSNRHAKIASGKSALVGPSANERMRDVGASYLASASSFSRRFSRESVLFVEGTIEDSTEADGGTLRNSILGIGGYYTF